MTAPSKPQRLPASWVERIWDRMQGRYGNLWADRWRTGRTVEVAGQPIDAGVLNAKLTWSEDLAPYAERAGVIAEALAALADKPLPPTLPEFVAACRLASAKQSRSPAQQRLEHTPSADDWQRAQAIAREVFAAFRLKSVRGES